MDFIFNGQSNGSVAEVLLQNDFNPNVLRPYLGDDGRSYVTMNHHGGRPEAVQVHNVNATLRLDEWKQLDAQVLKAARQRLALVADLRRKGLTYNIANGLGTTVLQSEKQSDVTGAQMSMDALEKNERDRPEYEVTNLPLPISHKGFSFSARQLATSRRGGSPLDTTMAEMSGRAVAENIEKLAIGSLGYKYGGGDVYGITNFPDRITTVSITDPTDSGWVGKTLVSEILQMRQASVSALNYGPWSLYVSTGWDQYLDQDYSDSKGDITLRQRIEQIRGIQDVTTLDYLTGLQIVLVQNTTDTVRLVNGMDIMTLQWPTNGGLSTEFKVMAIQVPQIRSDINGRCGLVHGVVS